MNKLIEIHNRLLNQLGEVFTRDAESLIKWNSRLVLIKGARGVGKTTLMLKFIRENHYKDKDCLYLSLDNLYFTQNSLVDLADNFYKKGGRRLFIDEVHRLEDWSVQIKNIYDSYPKIKMVVTGSSMLELLQGQADLSRRAVTYELAGLSFREYLQIETRKSMSSYSLKVLLKDHEDIARTIVSDIQPLAHWQGYLQHGFFPFYLEGRNTYRQRLENVIHLVLDVDIPQCAQIDLKYIPRIKRLLYMIAVSAPMKPNISKLSAAIEVSRQTISQYLEYLQHAALINLIRSDKRGHGMLTKPEKIVLHNTNLAHTIASEDMHTGTMRETFFVNQVSQFHDVKIPERGDFILDAQWTFEVGGRAKTGLQIHNIKNAYIAADDIETGHNRQIPLWLFGFLS